jgi:hypothetical protein
MPDSNSNAVSIMEAAFLAQVHVSNIYRIRIKRAHDVLATAAAIEDKTVES